MTENVHILFTPEELDLILEYTESIKAETVQDAVINAIKTAMNA